MSAYPLAYKRQFEWNDLKMAMSVKGKNRHYHWQSIQRSHWLKMANICRFPEAEMKIIIADIFDNMAQVIAKVTDNLPAEFPEKITESIFDGMKQVKSRA